MIRLGISQKICLLISLVEILCSLWLSVPTYASDDVIIILDQSKSMKEKVPGNEKLGYENDPSNAKKSKGAIEAVNQVVGDFLKEGDYFAFIVFGDKAELRLSQEILYKHERELIANQLKTLSFEDHYTDILAGLKESSDLLNKSLHIPQRRKILVMITDGRNEPPPDSLYLKEEHQQEILTELRDSIRFNNWNVTLVGLGSHTDIAEIAEKLGLPLNKALSIGEHQEPIEIQQQLATIFIKQQKARIDVTGEKMSGGKIKLQMYPRLFGGYKDEQISLTLKSFFDEQIRVSLKTGEPFSIGEDKNFRVTAEPLDVNLSPQQSAQLNLTVYFQGNRTSEGRINRQFTFHFSEGSTCFYPYQGTIEIDFLSWWEIYGLWVNIFLVVTLLLLIWIVWSIRRAMVLEIRIAVLAGNKSLSEPITLRRKETFVIADIHHQFGSGRCVLAEGLSCSVAAKVQYLGRRKFEVIANEATIKYNGKECRQRVIGMNDSFDLEDTEGHCLRAVTISEPGTADIFGDHDDSSPF